MSQAATTHERNPAHGAAATVVTSGSGYRAQQGSDYLPGVSAESVGSKVLWLGMVTLEPGQRTRSHVHAHHETAFHMLSGDEVELWSGQRLQERSIVRPGDYLFIPPNVPHVAVNRSEEPAVFIGARNEPTAQESVVMYPELDKLVP